MERLGNELFDIAIIGGGASGLGAAVDAASRGYRTILLEAGEIASGTSNRSTKLIHGGVRYLAQGRFHLVREALAERAVLRRIAPALVWEVGIVVPVEGWLGLGYYAAGLKLYDALAGKANLAASRLLSSAQTFASVPNLRRDRFRGGIRYVDAQFDDAALARALARTAESLGAAVMTGARVVRFLRDRFRITGLVVRDSSQRETSIRARVALNATGVWTDEIRQLGDPAVGKMMAPSRGSHLVLPAAVLGGRDGFLIPRTGDGRVIFALPFKGQTLVGTTDVPVASIDRDPQASDDEIRYLIAHLNAYLEVPVTRRDVLATFAGLRPLIGAGARSSSALSREHVVEVGGSGLVTVAGGKWTTYRRMAKDAVDCAARVAGLAAVPSRTDTLMLRTES